MCLAADLPRAVRLRELSALVHVMTRYWIRVFPHVRYELHAWRCVAEAIPDPILRRQALDTLQSERLSTAGAALFAATTTRHEPTLVRTLIAYQVICDYLDTLAEQPTDDPVANGARLHRALADALDLDRPHHDYYLLHPVRDDGGYLVSLVDACRAGCATLPAYRTVREIATREARRNEVQGINHGPPRLREPALRAWAHAQEDAPGDATWFELAAAGSSSLAALALLAAAADPALSTTTAERTQAVYFPWIEALSTLLDSLADREHDTLTGELNFVSQYDSATVATARLRRIAARAITGARELPHGERHVVLVAGMIAMHLSEETAWTPASRVTSIAVVHAADATLVRFLLVVLRRWRRLNDRRAVASQN